jgi:DNA-3-methyladenine glycosylase
MLAAPDGAIHLTRDFYAGHTLDVARRLLGKLLLRRGADGRLGGGRIVETEAYHGHLDRASHAHGGPTPRSAIMYGPPGFAYVYQIYGVWFCLNAVTGADGFPSAVLLRAVAQVPGLVWPGDHRAGAGPGKLCRALAIDRRDNGLDLCASDRLWIADDGVRARRVGRGPRIGVAYAGCWATRRWRFWIDGDAAVSRRG